jgi:cytochrome c-type biogenesis protein CcmH/NrfF
MRGLLKLIVVLLALAAALPAVAVQPDEVLADATLEARARALSKELRCMVCQNQSIDDSDAPFAAATSSRKAQATSAESVRQGQTHDLEFSSTHDLCVPKTSSVLIW